MADGGQMQVKETNPSVVRKKLVELAAKVDTFRERALKFSRNKPETEQTYTMPKDSGLSDKKAKTPWVVWLNQQLNHGSNLSDTRRLHAIDKVLQKELDSLKRAFK